MSEESEQRRSASPPPSERNGTNGSAARGPAHAQSTSLLSVARRIDSGAKIVAVIKSHDATLVKIDPTADLGSTSMFALLTALRVAFPFATVTATESAASGLLQFHVLVYNESDELQHAMDLCRDYRSMRLLRAVSTGFLVGGLCAYGALLHASMINLES